MKLFSVVIPNKGREKMLFNAVDSVLSQSFTDFEIIIVDDSTGMTHGNIVKKMRSYPNVRVLSGPSSGSADARLLGIKESKGKYIALLDSDDRWNPDKLVHHFNCHMKLEKVGICFDLLLEEKEGKSKKIPLPFTNDIDLVTYEKVRKEVIFRKLIQENFIHMSCGSFRNNEETIRHFPLNEPQDYLFWLRMSAIEDFGLISSHETIKNIHDGNRGSQKKILLQENLVIQIEKLRLVLKNGLLSNREKMKYAIYALLSISAIHIIMPTWIKRSVIRKNKHLLFKMIEG